jgi:ElaB/YqjD/DUF883 family membrane-anchored ribosome-binding protein
MELYYKDLISEEATLEKLVDDLMYVVQGGKDISDSISTGIHGNKREEIIAKLQILKQGCSRLKEQAMLGAQATDRFLRRYPYSVVATAVAGGLVLGFLFARKRR